MLRKTLFLTALLIGLGTTLFAQAIFVFTPLTLPDAQYGSPYAGQTFTVIGGVAPYTFSVTAGSLPPGMSLSPSGTISGTPTSAGSFSFTVTATDSDPLGPFTGSQAYTLNADPAPLTITANNVSMVYGGTLPAFGVTYGGFVNGDNANSLTVQPSVTVPANASSPAGSYTITPSGASDPNYTISYVNGTFTITPAALTITANNASMTYGGTVPSLSASYSGFVNSDNSASLTTQPTVSTTAASTSPAGTYPTTASGAVDANYSITYAAGTMTVGKATLTVTANNQSMPLGGPLPAFTVSYSGFVNGDGASSLSTQPTATTLATAASPAGTYPITPGGGSSSNYAFTYVNGTLTVAQAILTITANPASSIYGAALVPDGSLPVTYTGFVNGDGPSSLATLPTVSNTASAGSPVGTYILTPSGASDPNYTIQYVTGVYTIQKAPLTITANNANMTYGGTVPSLSESYSGFVNGDAASSLTTQPTVSTTATSASPAGTYPITASGAADANYTITYTAGTMTVGKATLTVTANNQSMPLGGPLPAFTVSYTGFVNGDAASSLTTPPTATTTATASSPAGTYPITPVGGSSPNYTFTYVDGTLSIGKALLTITANPASSVYGAALVPDGSLTVSYSGFVNGDGPGSLATLPTVANSAIAGSPVGTYTLTPSGAADPNYTFQYVTGVYTIQKAALTINAVNQTMTYGGSVPVLTASYSGFVNGDGTSALTTAPTITTTATSASQVGAYPITASGATAPNYTITYTSGTMTVGKATLTVTANNQTMALGGPLPIFTVSYTGFVNGDGASSLTTQSTATTTATASSPAGAYLVVPSGGSSPNYTFTYVDGTLSIGKALLTITANPASSVYGAALVPDGSLTVSYSGFVSGDGPSSLSTLPTVTNSASAGDAAGTYTLTASGADDPNYNIAYVTGVYTIQKAALNIAGLSQTMTYGSAVPALTASYTGFVNGDNASSLASQPTITTTATPSSPVGTYPITASGAGDPNYTITYTAGTMTVQRAALTVTANSESMNYGGPVPALTASYTGFVNGDNASSLTTKPTITTTATTTSPPGTYPITVSGAADPNYTITYVGGTMTVGGATLTVTANSASMIYGGTVPTLTVSYSGFINGDNASSLTTAPTVTTTATSSSSAGDYPITVSGAVDPNYTIVYVAGTLTINPATLHITANAQTKEYGAADPPFTFTVSGYLNGDNSDIFTGSLSRAPGENVGTYPITEGTLGAGNNYSIVYTGNYLTITKAQQQITWAQNLLVGCNSVTQVLLTGVTSSGLPITYSVSDPAIAKVSGDTLTLLQPGSAHVTGVQAGDSNYDAAAPVTDTIVYESASLISQHWNDVLFFDNSSGDYVAWQWYKNGAAVPGDTAQYYSEEPSLNGQYFVIATNKDGQEVQTCTLSIAPGAAIPGGIKVFPNPANIGTQVSVVFNYSASALQGAVLQISDLTGKVIQQLTNIQPSMQVTMPSVDGIYILNLMMTNGQKVSTNILVE
ncbi:MAG TPA: MBG domain-containing protein [Puia sp.]|nr:MBG domain-containing protein [Puia sp.]